MRNTTNKYPEIQRKRVRVSRVERKSDQEQPAAAKLNQSSLVREWVAAVLSLGGQGSTRKMLPSTVSITWTILITSHIGLRPRPLYLEWLRSNSLRAMTAHLLFALQPKVRICLRRARKTARKVK